MPLLARREMWRRGGKKSWRARGGREEKLLVINIASHGIFGKIDAGNLLIVDKWQRAIELNNCYQLFQLKDS